MRIKLPEYNGKDNLVMLVVTPLFSFALNCINFGWQYFSGVNYFLLVTLVTAAGFTLEFILCGGVAVALKKRFASEAQLYTRLILMIVTFLTVTGLFLYSLFHLFESIKYFNYKFNQDAFTWCYIVLGIVNIFLTFLMEGIASYNDWKKNQLETEKLQEAYKQSQLQGLKSQVNPHFLFNSLNSLSSLIQEDEEAAEKFLDEMSKVYRYMLRTDEEQLVTLQTELKFLESYLHLLNARYTDGLKVEVDVSEQYKDTLIAPLSLQVIIENSFSQNVISKAQPLHITIAASETGLIIKNDIQPKLISDAVDFEAGLDNLIRKYELLNRPMRVEDRNSHQRVIFLPLITKQQEAAV